MKLQKNELALSTFLENDLVNYASYDNLRKIASCIDGLKNANRKVIYTILDKKIYDLTKVSQLSSKCAEHSDYLHGSLDGVVVTLTQDFLGSNQLPLLKKKGNFGTRAIPEASATRYIFAAGNETLKSLFNSNDTELLIKQSFEGYPIEPMFYVPDLPLLLINGSRGVSSGFAQNILPRPKDKILKICRKFFETQDSSNLDEIDAVKPYIGEFKGSVERDSDSKLQDVYKWIFEVDFELDEKKSIVTLKDIPYGEDLKGYLKFLDELEDAKKIKSYDDLSNGDEFTFKVKFAKSDFPKNKEAVIKLFKLRTSITENFTSIDENNKIITAVKPSQILKVYGKVKLEYLQKRKDLLISNLQHQISKNKSIKIFIDAVLNRLDIKGWKVQDYTSFFDSEKLYRESEASDPYAYLRRIPMQRLALEEVNKLDELIKKEEKELNEIKEMSLRDVWGL